MAKGFQKRVIDAQLELGRVMVMALPCTYCGAGQGQPCTVAGSDAPAANFHAPRRRALRRSGVPRVYEIIIDLAKATCPRCEQAVGRIDLPGLHECGTPDLEES